MPLTSTEKSRIRRERARKKRLCITCAVNKPRRAHKVCDACIALAYERVKARRARKRLEAAVLEFREKLAAVNG